MDARLDDQTERLTQFLRGLAAKGGGRAADFEEAADLLDRLYADLFLAEEKIALLEAPDEPPREKTVTQCNPHGKRVTVAAHRGRPIIVGPPKPSS